MRTQSNRILCAVAVAAICVAGCHDTTAPATTTPGLTLNALNTVSGLPAAWGIDFTGQPATFWIGVQSAISHGGGHAGFIQNSVASPSITFAQFSQFVRADAYLGHRVRLSGWLLPLNVSLPASTVTAAPTSGLWMRVDGADSSFAFDNMTLRPVVGTSDWQQFSVVLDVPANAVGIQFGVIFSGTGTLFADDLALTVVDSSVASTGLGFAAIASPNIGTYYKNAPSTPVNLDFEAASQASASLHLSQTHP